MIYAQKVRVENETATILDENDRRFDDLAQDDAPEAAGARGG